MDDMFPMRPVRSSSWLPQLIMMCFGVALAASGAWLVNTAWREYRLCRTFATYPTVQGVVTHCTTTSQTGAKGRVTYSVQIEYRYTVAGVTYTSEQPFVAPIKTSSANDAAVVASKYPPGSNVQVHHDPNHPDQALIDVRITPEVARTALLGAAIGSVGIGLAPFVIRSRRFIERDLPINTRRIDTGFLIEASIGWRGWIPGSAGVFALIVSIVYFFVPLPRDREPSVPLVAAICIFGAVLPIAVWLVLGRIMDPLGRAIVIDLQQGRLIQRSTRKGRPPALDVALESVVGVDLQFLPSKNAKQPAAPLAVFLLRMQFMGPGGTRSFRAFKSHEFHRNDANELAAWLSWLLRLNPESQALAQNA